ncbi:hypothetical protein SAMN03159341_104268 [Paenibacillus sp. 1_12]|nr:hypothetical protein SAMN03159341_104268 [Paenibacillus sp. 1_12]
MQFKQTTVPYLNKEGTFFLIMEGYGYAKNRIRSCDQIFWGF